MNVLHRPVDITTQSGRPNGSAKKWHFASRDDLLFYLRGMHLPHLMRLARNFHRLTKHLARCPSGLLRVQPDCEMLRKGTSELNYD